MDMVLLVLWLQWGEGVHLGLPDYAAVCVALARNRLPAAHAVGGLRAEPSFKGKVRAADGHVGCH